MGVPPNASIICAGDGAPAGLAVHRHRELEIADACFDPVLAVKIADDSNLTRGPRQNLHGATLTRRPMHRHAQAGFETRHRKGRRAGTSSASAFSGGTYCVAAPQRERDTRPDPDRAIACDERTAALRRTRECVAGGLSLHRKSRE